MRIPSVKGVTIKVITNAVRWVKPRVFIADSCSCVKPLEEIEPKDADS